MNRGIIRVPYNELRKFLGLDDRHTITAVAGLWTDCAKIVVDGPWMPEVLGSDSWMFDLEEYSYSYWLEKREELAAAEAAGEESVKP